MSKADALHERTAAFWRRRDGGVIVRRAARGTSLFSARTGAPIARLRPTGDDDRVQVLRWNGERWAASGPFGVATMPVDNALAYIAHEPDFWTNA